MNTAHVRTEEATNTRNGFQGDFVAFATPLSLMVSSEAMTEFVSATLSDTSAIRAVALRRLLRIHDNCPGAVSHRSIRMRNNRHHSHLRDECEGQGDH
jgi:hypothetical protein